MPCEFAMRNLATYGSRMASVTRSGDARGTANVGRNWSKGPLRSGPDPGLDRLANMKQTVHIADIKAEKAYAERDRLRVVTADIRARGHFWRFQCSKDDT